MRIVIDIDCAGETHPATRAQVQASDSQTTTGSVGTPSASGTAGRTSGDRDGGAAPNAPAAFHGLSPTVQTAAIPAYTDAADTPGATGLPTVLSAGAAPGTPRDTEAQQADTPGDEEEV